MSDGNAVPRLLAHWRVTQQFEARCDKCGWKRITYSEYEGRVQLVQHHCAWVDSVLMVPLNQMSFWDE